MQIIHIDIIKSRSALEASFRLQSLTFKYACTSTSACVHTYIRTLCIQLRKHVYVHLHVHCTVKFGDYIQKKTRHRLQTIYMCLAFPKV